MRRPTLALAIALAATGLAHAHSDTETTTPADGATVRTIEAIEIRFDDPMRVTRVVLTGPDGEVALEREGGLEPVTQVRALPVSALAPGAFTVEWRGLAVDGHPMQGGFGFTVAE